MAGIRHCPVLRDNDAGRARAVAFEIVAELEQLAPSANHGLKGDAAIAFLLAQCERSTAADRLESALAGLAVEPVTISLFSGLPGVAWVLRNVCCEDDCEPIIAHFDAAILRHLRVPVCAERHDLISGLVGVGAYVAGRHDDRALELASLVLLHLEAAAIVDRTGACWRTPPHLLSPTHRKLFPDGMIDIGVAHGVAGVVGMLARFVECDIEVKRSRSLLDLSLQWLWDYLPSTEWELKPHRSDVHSNLGRIGWCNGHAGVAAMLLHSGRVVGSPHVEAKALDLLRALATRTAEQRIHDACFCHGTSGLAHVYNVAFQRTGDEQMRVEAERWLTDTLCRRRPGVGIAGYQTLTADGRMTSWDTDTTLLSGVVGIALVLLAATEEQEPAWQRLFLL
jgi:lantibiotic biosynthesis protein